MQTAAYPSPIKEIITDPCHFPKVSIFLEQAEIGIVTSLRTLRPLFELLTLSLGLN